MFFKRKQQPYKITVVGQYGTNTYDCETEKAKNEWLYEYLSNDERMWAWEVLPLLTHHLACSAAVLGRLMPTLA